MAENITCKEVQTIQEVCDFLKKAGAYYLATNEGAQPHVRPFGTAHMYDGRLYIQTGRSKPVSQQMAVNPQVELCAMDGGTWIRVIATAVEDNSREAKQSMLDAYPFLKDSYSPDDEDTQVFYLKDVKATISAYAV